MAARAEPWQPAVLALEGSTRNQHATKSVQLAVRAVSQLSRVGVERGQRSRAAAQADYAKVVRSPPLSGLALCLADWLDVGPAG